MSNKFFDKAAQLDEAMRATGRPMPMIDSVMDLLQEPPLRAYFFTKLRDPSWLRPLRDRRAFDNPPPVHEESNGQIRFPLWPESRYLARVASDEPETVLEIILALPDTENIRVHEDLAEAA